MKIGISLPVREMQDDVQAICDFAQAAEELGFSHLRVPDQVFRPGSGHLHEPMVLLSYVAAVTRRIELVPSVVILPSRQTVLFAKQAATLDRLSHGRVRLGIGVGSSRAEYTALGQDFHTRGDRCTEQMQLLRRIWLGESVEYQGKFDAIGGGAINPAPVAGSIPLWIGGASVPSQRVIRRIGRLSDGWFVLCSPEQFAVINTQIHEYAAKAGRNPQDIGSEAGVAIVGPRRNEWQSRIERWRALGLTYACLRTLSGGLKNSEHIPAMEQAARRLDLS